MKIIKATWENRNLGRDAYEITLDRKDLKDFDAVLKEIHAQDFAGAYVVVKMPVGDLKALHALEDDGFRFMETQFHIERRLENYAPPEMLKLYQNDLIREEIPKIRSEWEKIVNLITSDMFTTDRIYLDPYLKQEMSSIRYKNWIMDLVDDAKAHLFVFKKGNNIIGYSADILDIDRRSVYGLLGGVFSSYQDKGLGLLLWDTSIQSSIKSGMKKMETAISSNNNAVLRLYMLFGYIIKKQTYVLRKLFS